jgi:hypothetical protein
MFGSLMVPLLVGCDPMTKGEFVGSYTTELCEHIMMCGDQAELTFDGILDQSDCFSLEEPGVGDWGVGCKMRQKDAEACLAAMDELTCPAAEGTLADRPLACETVFHSCDTTTASDDDAEEAPAPADPPSDSDVPEDSDAPAE